MNKKDNKSEYVLIPNDRKVFMEPLNPEI